MYGVWQGCTSKAFLDVHNGLPLDHNWVAVGKPADFANFDEELLCTWIQDSIQLDPSNFQYFEQDQDWCLNMVDKVDGKPDFTETLKHLLKNPQCTP